MRVVSSYISAVQISRSKTPTNSRNIYGQCHRVSHIELNSCLSLEYGLKVNIELIQRSTVCFRDYILEF